MKRKYKIKKEYFAGEKLYRGYVRVLWIFYFPFTKFSIVKEEISEQIDMKVWEKQRKKLVSKGY